MSSFEKECDSKRIECVRVYQPKFSVGGGSASSNSSQQGSPGDAGTNKKKSSNRTTAGASTCKIRLYNVVFLLAYIFQIGYVVKTIGEPYRLFLEKADREGFQG